VLAEQEQQAAGGPVGEVEGGVAEQAVDEFPSLAGVGRGAGPALRAGDCCPAFKTPMKAALGVPMWWCVKAPLPCWLRGFGGGGAGGCG